jgi:sugar lactone lactonase YvrE
MNPVRPALAAVTAAALGVGALSGAAQADPVAARPDENGGRTVVYMLEPSTHGNPEGVAWDKRTDRFFVGTVGDGTIYRGRLSEPAVRPFIEGAVGASAVGMKVFRGRLYIAGGSTGTITVYDIGTRARVASFDTGTGGFLNDLVVTGEGDVYVTDSFRPTLWHVTPAQVAAGQGNPDPIPVGPEITYQTGFNLNGIVGLSGGRELVVVNSASGRLFRIVVDRDAPQGRTISPIDAPQLTGGDGMIVDRGRLIVVIGSPATLTFLRLSADHLRARIDEVRTDPTLRGPSTVARAEDRYLVVNADFAMSRTPFTVSGLPRHLPG